MDNICCEQNIIHKDIVDKVKGKLLDEDITIELDESKPTSDLFVRYLHAMKLKQDMQRLEKKQQSLDKEKSDIKRRKNELFGK